MSRVTVITLSVLLFVGLVAAVTIGVLNYVNNDDKRPSTSTKAVQEMCQPTDYKEACFKSLSKVNTDDPKELVKAAFESTIAEISEVLNKSLVLKELEKDPKTTEAVKDCKELFQDAIDDLQRSFSEMGEFDFNKVDKMLENLKIWLSATLTYQETCLDGFDNSTGDASEKVRKILQLSMQMSSNGLAIVSEMSNLLGTLGISSFNRRRLLADDRQVMGHHHDSNINPYWQSYRRLLTNDNSDSTLLEDDEPDRRRRRLLSSANRVEGHDEDFIMPFWLDGSRRKLLQATNLAEDLKSKAHVVVAQDGSGKYKTIQEAINVIPKYGNESFIIYIKEGVYKEYLVLFKWMTHVVFVGDGPTKTRITNNQNFADGVKTFKTATLSVLGDYFMGKDIGIENSAGAIKHQAVALRVQSDQSIFYNCHMDGYQDTLYTHTYRQFYRDCRVTGTIDFIFGDAAAFFQNCTFVVRKPLENQRCIVTAQGRMERHQPTGIIIHRCRFVADPDYYPVRKTNTAYLGRPWKEYSKTIIMESYIDDSISPDGWLPWEGTFALDTCYYGEFNNVGPGCDMTNRVKWRGIKTIEYDRAEKLMPPQLYGNDDWIRASGVPYDPNLSGVAPGPIGFDEIAPDGAPLDLPTYPYGSSSGTSSTSSSSSQASSGGISSSSSSSSGSSSSGSGTSQGSSSSSSVGQGSNSNGASQSTTAGSGSGSTGYSSSTTTPSTNNGGSSVGGSTGSSSTPATSTGSSFTTTPSTSSGGSTGYSSTTTPSTSSGGSTGSSSTTTPSTSSGGSTGGGSTGSSSTTTPSTNSGGSTGGGSTGSSSTTTPSTNSGGSIEGGSTGSSSSTTVEGSSTGGPSQSTTLSVIDAPAPSPISTEEITPIDAPTPTIAPLATSTPPTAAIISQSETVAPVAAQQKEPSTQSPTSSPIQTGPITVRELERILMTNEEMHGEEEANDDMSGNVPDGDEPSPAMVDRTPTQAPTASIVVSPIVSPSGSSPTSDWLSPATAPEPDVEPADKMPPTVAPPPKANNARSNSKLYELHVILSGMIIWVVLAM